MNEDGLNLHIHSAIVRKVPAKYPEHPWILAGKSLGSRVSCMVAAEKDIEASAVVCLGYSLKDKDTHEEPVLDIYDPDKGDPLAVVEPTWSHGTTWSKYIVEFEYLAT